MQAFLEFVVKGLVAMGDDVEQVADRNDVANPECLAMVYE